MSTTEFINRQSADARPPSPAADRTLTLLETLVAADGPLTLTALAKLAGIPLATAALFMQTLEARGYASRRAVGRNHFWSPTLRLGILGSRLLAKHDLPALAQPYLSQLSDDLNLAAHVGVLDGSNVVYVARATTGNFVQFNTHVGRSAPFNLTALGKAIAANRSDTELRELARGIVTGAGPRAKAGSSKVLLEELEQVRVRGYAVEDEEQESGIACVAAPIFDSELRVVGSVGVAGFRSDVVGDRSDEITAAVTQAGAKISAALGAPTPTV